MSAYLLGQAALSNLAWEFVQLQGDCLRTYWKPRLWPIWPVIQDGEFPQRVFEILLAENLRSLLARYGARSLHERHMSRRWRFLPPSLAYRQKPRDARALLDLCAEYNYQAAETHDFDRSKAAEIIQGIQEAALRSLVPASTELNRPLGDALPEYL